MAHASPDGIAHADPGRISLSVRTYEIHRTVKGAITTVENSTEILLRPKQDDHEWNLYSVREYRWK